MPWILETTLSNALIATAMGLIVVAVSRFLRHRPAVTHAMWLIVLLKLVTPPFVHVPINVGLGTRYASSSALRESAAKHASSSPVGTGVGEGRSRANAGQSGSDVVTMESEFQRQMAARGSQARKHSAIWTLALSCWLIGTGVWVAVAVVRIIRFSRLLRVARRCSQHVATIASRVAGRLGLTKTPVIEVVDSHISPLVWHGGRTPRIVLPCELVSRWTDDRIELVLAHEIAHVKRGDHWIRWFTLAVLAACWWHPIAWMAVRRLRVAEEQCCDAMVIAALPGRAHAYAETLLATLDLLVARRSPPVLASGIASGGSLKRRCEMILSDQTTFRIGRATGLLLLLSAICILPLAAMVRADDEPAKEKAAAQLQDADEDQAKRDEQSQIENALREYEKLFTTDGSVAAWHKNLTGKSRECLECHKMPDRKQSNADGSIDHWHKNAAWKTKECLECHDIAGRDKQSEAVGKSLEDYANQVRLATRNEKLERAKQGLRNLGFDEKLIEALLKDRVKAKSANQVLQNILRLTEEDHAATEKDEARLQELFRSGRLRMPKHAMTAEDRDRIIRYLLSEDH